MVKPINEVNASYNHIYMKLACGYLPQCQTDGLNSFSASAKQTILTPNEIANSTYIYTACDRGKR
jgi:hypothetical protein